MIKSILIANRGEIACRIIKTAAKLGIESSVVYSKEDEDTMAVKVADKAFLLNDPRSESQEYLDAKQIISIVKQNKIDAIHPGYGFLSENFAFAKSVEENGIKFIGPSYQAIQIMGDKIVSKLQAKNCGLSVIPGVDSEISDLSKAKKIAKKIGFPVMVKASAGGGGKGMRVIHSEKNLEDDFQSAINEAISSFGDGRIFIEKFIENPHHIEIQIIGDRFGNFIHLGERDCSIQRRNQKIIEESPSPFIDTTIRNKMAAQAIKLAESVKYLSAGTVEFIVDKEKNFYFLEMNTRLQVEHPVTELTTDIDIVEEMINVASGEPLRFKQKDISFNGCAMEVRVYAEDPSRDFMPSAGRLTKYFPPEEFKSDKKIIRNDSGVFEGSNISFKYDPMISKLCVWTSTRKETLEMIQEALTSFRIEGIKNNLNFLSDILSKEKFLKGQYTTSFLDREYPNGFSGVNLSDNDFEYLTSAVLSLFKFCGSDRKIQSALPTKTFANNSEEYFIHFNNTKMQLSWSSSEGHHLIKNKNKKKFLVKINTFSFNRPTKIKVNSRNLNLWCQRRTDGFLIKWKGYEGELKIYPFEISKMIEFLPEKNKIDSNQSVISPMPGLLVSMDVKVGDDVQIGQRLCALEAMKMENVLYAERTGVIKSIYFNEGEILSDGDKILEYK